MSLNCPQNVHSFTPAAARAVIGILFHIWREAAENVLEGSLIRDAGTVS